MYKDLTKKEGFDATSDIKAVIGQVYNADIEAIRNLSSIAAKLQVGGLTVPGNLLLQSGTVIDLGSNDTAREPNAGKIGYSVFEDSLNIVGKGKPGESRRTTLWENLKVTGKLATNNLDPNNMPDGWGGGLRIVDGYASGTMGFGPDGKALKAYMNSNGDAFVSNTLRIGSWILRDYNGHLQFVKDGTAYNNDYNAIPADQGFLAMAQNGDFWHNQRRTSGWISDIIYNSIPGAFLINGGGGAFPIYSTMSAFGDKVGMNDVDDCYVIMKGYKLVIYRDGLNSDSRTFDNTNGGNSKYFNASWNNLASSCRLYCRGVEVPEVSYG